MRTHAVFDKYLSKSVWATQQRHHEVLKFTALDILHRSNETFQIILCPDAF